MHRLSELQGDDPMILLLGRGEHCPRERQHQKELIKLYEWCAVGFTSMVTVLPNDQHETYKLKISTPAQWTYLCDEHSRSSARSGSTSTPTPTTTPPCRTRWSSPPAS